MNPRGFPGSPGKEAEGHEDLRLDQVQQCCCPQREDDLEEAEMREGEKWSPGDTI